MDPEDFNTTWDDFYLKIKTYPYTGADGNPVWACCESTIGPPCAHKAVPAPVEGEVKPYVDLKDDLDQLVTANPILWHDDLGEGRAFKHLRKHGAGWSREAEEYVRHYLQERGYRARRAEFLKEGSLTPHWVTVANVILSGEIELVVDCTVVDIAEGDDYPLPTIWTVDYYSMVFKATMVPEKSAVTA